MIDLLLAPGAPYFAISLAGVMVAAYGLWRIERARLLYAGVRALPGRWGMRGRYLLGQTAALPLAMLLLLAMVAGGVTGTAQLLLIASALALYLYLGVLVPRRPLAQARRERIQLRRLTPGFVSYVRIALAGHDSPTVLLERYVARPRPRRRPMQRVVAEALELMRERRLRPFEALRAVARARGCQELIDVAEALTQAESEGSDVQAVLMAQAAMLEAVLKDEFSRSIKRRTLYLLGLVAVSLVVGILGNLLFVMTRGSGLLPGSKL